MMGDISIFWFLPFSMCESLKSPSTYRIVSYRIVMYISEALVQKHQRRGPKKQVSFQQCCECSRWQCQITNAGWQTVPGTRAGGGKWSVTQCSSCTWNVEHWSISWSRTRTAGAGGRPGGSTRTESTIQTAWNGHRWQRPRDFSLIPSITMPACDRRTDGHTTPIKSCSIS